MAKRPQRRFCRTETRSTSRRRTRWRYDPATGKTVLFGGIGNGTSGETWEWDGTTWTQRFPTNGPAPRHGHTMVYDAVRSRVVLYGGLAASGPQSDT